MITGIKKYPEKIINKEYIFSQKSNYKKPYEITDIYYYQDGNSKQMQISFKDGLGYEIDSRKATPKEIIDRFQNMDKKYKKSILKFLDANEKSFLLKRLAR